MSKQRRISFAVSDDEFACLHAAAKKQRARPAAFAREASLFAAGWEEYSGPLFVPEAKGAERDRSAVAIAHTILRGVTELARHQRLRFKYREPSDPDAARMLIAYCGLLLKYEAPVRAMRHAPGAVDLVERLWWQGHGIAEHHGLLGTTIKNAAETMIVWLGGRLEHLGATAVDDG